MCVDDKGGNCPDPPTTSRATSHRSAAPIQEIPWIAGLQTSYPSYPSPARACAPAVSTTSTGTVFFNVRPKVRTDIQANVTSRNSK
ncbi:hypothetical protein AVEN_152763-1 [Araneus ventricosus]|uniref:Uncharacterized protein n=1 Tax=Araneus ventricosus TaxID=182803 RepID=A0A4Y2R880_ARAVE|nr:hypothetical protein AVEN_152763-1 [Araneus ventricosus]